MVELVIVLAIMGILAVTVIPMYSQMQAKSQFTRNRANMEIIKDAFLNHFYHTYSNMFPYTVAATHMQSSLIFFN